MADEFSDKELLDEAYAACAEYIGQSVDGFKAHLEDIDLWSIFDAETATQVSIWIGAGGAKPSADRLALIIYLMITVSRLSKDEREFLMHKCAEHVLSGRGCKDCFLARPSASKDGSADKWPGCLD